VIEPQWLRLDVVVAIHAEQLAEHGGLQGLCDRSGLESAIASPRNLLAYGNPMPDMAAMAAQYVFAIGCNQVFIDGNKRTALVVCRSFLILNGHELNASQDEKYTMFIKLANREIDVGKLAEWFREPSADLSGSSRTGSRTSGVPSAARAPAAPAPSG
jgi:death-on-curing protein